MMTAIASQVELIQVGDESNPVPPKQPEAAKEDDCIECVAGRAAKTETQEHPDLTESNDAETQEHPDLTESNDAETQEHPDLTESNDVETQEHPDLTESRDEDAKHPDLHESKQGEWFGRAKHPEHPVLMESKEVHPDTLTESNDDDASHPEHPEHPEHLTESNEDSDGANQQPSFHEDASHPEHPEHFLQPSLHEDFEKQEFSGKKPSQIAAKALAGDDEKDFFEPPEGDIDYSKPEKDLMKDEAVEVGFKD